MLTGNGYDENDLPILDESFLKVYSQVAARHRASKNALRYHFEQLRKQNGWTANVIERSAEASKEGAAQMKEAVALIDANYSSAICNAVPIGEEEYRKLTDIQKTKRITPSDENSMRRYELASFYCRPVDADLIKLDDRGKGTESLCYGAGARNSRGSPRGGTDGH